MPIGNGVPPRVKNPEQRMISEYLLAKFPTYAHRTRQPLGPGVEVSGLSMTASGALRASRPWRPEVDAIVFWDGVLLLIEGKVKEYFNGLAKLPMYAALVPETPELEGYATWPVRMRLVVPRAAPWVQRSAELAGVEIDVYEPDWIREYWGYRDLYWTRDYRLRREQRNAARRDLGLD